MFGGKRAEVEEIVIKVSVPCVNLHWNAMKPLGLVHKLSCFRRVTVVRFAELLLLKRVRCKNNIGTLRFYTNSESLRDATPTYP